MILAYEDLAEIEKDFEIKNGAWTREAVSYVGLSYPLQKGWKERLITVGTPKDAPIAKGVHPLEWRWTHGEDLFFEDDIDTKKQEDLYNDNPALYVKGQLNILEDAVNDLRKEADNLKIKIKEMRDLVSEDDF